VRDSYFRHDSSPPQLFAELPDAALFQVVFVDQLDYISFNRIDHQLALFYVTAEGRHSSHPHAFALGGRDLVTNALAGDLGLELGKREQDVQGQPPIEVVVLNCWVTATNEAPCASNSSTILAKSASDRVKRSTL